MMSQTMNLTKTVKSSSRENRDPNSKTKILSKDKVGRNPYFSLD